LSSFMATQMTCTGDSTNETHVHWAIDESTPDNHGLYNASMVWFFGDVMYTFACCVGQHVKYGSPNGEISPREA